MYPNGWTWHLLVLCTSDISGFFSQLTQSIWPIACQGGQAIYTEMIIFASISCPIFVKWLLDRSRWHEFPQYFFSHFMTFGTSTINYHWLITNAPVCKCVHTLVVHTCMHQHTCMYVVILKLLFWQLPKQLVKQIVSTCKHFHFIGHPTLLNDISGTIVHNSHYDFNTWGPFHWHGLTLIQAWISNHMPNKVWE